MTKKNRSTFRLRGSVRIFFYKMLFFGKKVDDGNFSVNFDVPMSHIRPSVRGPHDFEFFRTDIA